MQLIDTDNVALLLDGSVTFLKGTEGCEVFAEVVDEPTPRGKYVKKHLGPPRPEEILIHLGMSMTDSLFDWIATSWGGSATQKDGAILIFDNSLNVTSERQFSKALIASTIMPPLDVSSKDPVRLTVRLKPESTKVAKATVRLSPGPLGIGTKQKLWQTSNFRLVIDGLDCSRVNRIDSFTVETGESGEVNFPSMAVSFAVASADTWTAWFNDFVVNGNNQDSFERQGRIDFLAPDLKTVFVSVELHGLGISKLGLDQQSSRQAVGVVRPSIQVLRARAELYCEQMVLTRADGNP